MADTTTVMALPFPEGSDANDVPADMQALAERLDEAPGIESLTSAEIAALTAGQKPAGRVVYNSTTSKLQVSNGSTFANIDAAALLLAGGTMSGAIAMGSNKITGLAAGTTAGDAVRYEQLATTDATVAALGTYTAWTPTLTASSSNPTAANVTAESRYTQIGKMVVGIGQMTVTGAGGGQYRVPLPAAPRSTAAFARRIGTLQLDAGGMVRHFLLEQANGATYCNAVEFSAGDAVEFLTSSIVTTWMAFGPTTLSWDFTYEAA
ncbi:MAG: hypothetical protein IPK64_20470 [bacterium]|nr:hypothetical protein [bacterium]